MEGAAFVLRFYNGIKFFFFTLFCFFIIIILQELRWNFQKYVLLYTFEMIENFYCFRFEQQQRNILLLINILFVKYDN